jgi:alkanesulfonate monooxygenase SsuD/methylene tetrahydromethanopterin reductase-like flavin-dependent oxidoreductase (luciferase family)
MRAGGRPRAARYADAWFGHPSDRLGQRLADLDAALAAEGRDGTTLRRTVGVEVRGSTRLLRPELEEEDL